MLARPGEPQSASTRFPPLAHRLFTNVRQRFRNDPGDAGATRRSHPHASRSRRRAVASLANELRGIFSIETVARFVEESIELLGDARVTEFLPVLAHRFARERLRALAQAEGSIAKEVPEVLFVCVQNAGRSQMAAALLNHRAQGKVHVRTAGSAPAEHIHPEAIAALAELGIDLAQEFPKPLTDEVVRAADAVITMGCGDACPIYPGKRYQDWEVGDPADQALPRVRAIRDEIDVRVQALLAELAPT
ncbi:MAG: arsenate reductase ArsC [Actinobacteria bacterium]|nr:arsenate reductase ArsC [Actinomycetota bacterium]